MKFTDRFAAELKVLNEAVASFAKENPQIAPFSNENSGNLDPFIGQLLEGVAFLSARVHSRLDQEFVEFSQQALSALLPLYQSVTPSIAVCQLQPDFSSPDLFRAGVVSKGSQIELSLPNRKRNVKYSVARSTRILPLMIVDHCYTDTMPVKSDQSEATLVENSTYLTINFKFADGVSVRDVMRRNSHGVVNVFLSGDEDAVGHVFTLLSFRTNRIFIADHAGKCVNIGLNKFEARIESDIGSFLGGVFGLNKAIFLAREYASCPQKFFSWNFDIADTLTDYFSEVNRFSLVIELVPSDTDVASHFSRVDFSLFCVPSVNLYEKRLDPIVYNNEVLRQDVVVDRAYPGYFHLWRVTDVNVYTKSNSIFNAKSADCIDVKEAVVYKYSLCFNDNIDFDKADPFRLPANISGIFVSSNDSTQDPNFIHHLEIKGLVADTNWIPLDVDKNAGVIHAPGILNRASIKSMSKAARVCPSFDQCWRAVGLLGIDIFSSDKVLENGWLDITHGVRKILELSFDVHNEGERNRLEGLRLVRSNRRYMSIGREDLRGVVLGVDVEIYLISKHFPYGGAGLFGLIVAHIIFEFLDLNDGFVLGVYIDDCLMGSYSNLIRADGGLSLCKPMQY